MVSNPELELIYKVANAPIMGFPFPHVYIRDIFPADFYRDLLDSFPDAAQMKPIAEVRPVKGYKERFVMNMSPEHLGQLSEVKKKFWEDFSKWLLAGRFADVLLNKFGPIVRDRFKNHSNVTFYNEMLLTRDTTHYAIGPHTDSGRKVVTVLFYLPKDDLQVELGTSIYVPKQAGFTCPGGPHHGFENFSKVHTMPFLPNSVFMFVKTNNSFHAVEPVKQPDCNRWTLMFDVYIQLPPAQPSA